jgi:hypothetical protein
MSLYDKLSVYASKHYNVMLVGRHGIGKTTIVKELAQNLNYKFKYYSASTLDPFSDLVGIPVPDIKNKRLDFIKPEDLKDAEFIFFDELNRAHPKVLNAVLEIIQFKSVNGEKLNNLKMVWAAINPPGEEYDVEDLDPALVDRFHAFIKMKPEINLTYMSKVLGKELSRALHDWWNNDLDDKQRNLLSPRRMEYIGLMIKDNIDYRDAVPQGHTFPTPDLDRRVKSALTGEEEMPFTKEAILANKDKFFKKVQEDPRIALKLSNIMVKFNNQELFDCRDIVESMTKEMVMRLSDKKFAMKKRELLEMFAANNVDLAVKYPKMAEAFKVEA